MKRLVDNVTSQYVEAMNRLRPKTQRQRIVAYVESYEDVAFWRLLLDEFESDRYYFQIMLPNGKNLTRGKKSALNHLLEGDGLGQYMIACVDSDYDYLMQGATQTSAMMLSNPYVIQTFAYAIENYQCYAGSLNQVCVQATLNDRRLIDFEAYLELYSRIAFPLFAWNVLFYRKKLHNQFPMQELDRCIRIEPVDFRMPQLSLDRLQLKVTRKIDWLESNFPELKASAEALMQELPELGVTEDATYMYIQGHHFMETLIYRLLDPVCTALRREREMEIQHLAQHEEQRKNELRAYEHSQIPIQEALVKNTHYRDSAPYQRIREQVRRLVESLKGVIVNDASRSPESKG